MSGRQQSLIDQHGLEIRISEFVEAHSVGRGYELQSCARDDPDLAKACTHCLKEVTVVVQRAGDLLPRAGDHVQLEYVVALHAVAKGRVADPTDDQRACNRKIEIARQNRRRQLTRQRRFEHLSPRRAGANHNMIIGDSVNLSQLAHVDHETVACLGAAVDRVALPPCRNLAAPLARPADRGRHIPFGSRQQHAFRPIAYDMTEIVRRRCPAAFVELQRTIE